jgi:hypothetical protein
MKTTPKRNRSDSASAAVRAMQAVALGPLDPPAHVALRVGDRPFWNAIMTSRARDTWTEVDLCTAGNMARTQADIERLQKVIDLNGYVMDDGKLNPIAVLVETLTKRTITLARAIHVHAVATVGASEDAGKALGNERRAAAQDTDDDLIPRIRMVG